MENKNKRLGKGLEALFGGDVNEIIENIENNYNKDEVVQIPLNQIHPNPFQPRQVFDEEKIDELAVSINNHGVFQPIIVKKASSGYNIVAGERRYRASKKIELETIPALVVDFNDELMMEVALLENIQRENLNPLEEAHALKMIMEKYNYTQEELAKKMGKSRSHIANTLRLLNLNKKIHDLILNGKISMGHAKILIGLEKENLEYVTSQIVDNSLSVRECEKLVNELKTKTTTSNKKKHQLSSELLEIENLIREKFATKVKLNTNNVTIYFENDDDLEMILEKLDIKL